MKKAVLSNLLVYACFSLHAFAQVNATVGGTVSDASGALIPGVEVTARNINTGIVASRVTNESGNYEFPSLQPGSYTLSASLPGFQSSAYNNVQLNQGQQVRLNFALQVATVAAAVEVVAEADTILATTTASVGDVLPESQLTSLPVATRNVLDLVDLVPGLVGDCAERNCSFGGSRTNEINTTRDGLRTSDGRYDNGVYSGIFTSPDLVEAVRISATSIDAGTGRGTAQVQMQTRAGTNQFHGALFYTNNNSALNAQGWFQNVVGAEKTYQNRNQFGGRLGGPIIRNKAFFFVLVDEQRFLEKQNVTTTVLTAPARQGIFRFLTANATGVNGGAARRNGNAFSTIPSVDLAGNVLTADPLSGAPLFLNSFNVFSDVRDPNRPRIDPTWVASQYLPRMPLPNDWTMGDGLNTAGFRWLRRHEGLDSSVGTSPNTNRNHLTMRLDYQIDTNNKLTYTMSRETDWGVTGQTGLPDFPGGYFGDVRRVPDFYTAAWTSTISPTILNEVRFGLKRDTWSGTSGFDKGCCYSGSKEENDVVDTAKEARDSFPQVGGYFVYAQPGLSLGRYVNFGVASPRSAVSPFTQIADTLSFTKGRHSYQAGFELNLASTHQSNHGGQATTRPLAVLGLGNTPIPGLNATNFRGLQSNDITTAENLLTTLAGSIGQINEQFFVNSPTQTDWSDYRETFLFRRDLHQNDWFAFFKDNWKLANSFTLNLGIRYDKYGTPYDALGLGGRIKGGQAGLFSISGRDFSALWNPYATGGSVTETELVGKHSPNPDVPIFGNDWNNFAPSIGFSWSLPSNGRETVLRGGYGINYTGSDALGGYSGSIGNIPGGTLVVNYAPPNYVDLSTISSGIIPVPRGGARPFDPVPVTNRTAGITGYADDRRIPYVQSFTMSLQRELTNNLSMNISWVGNKGTKLWEGEQLNHTNIFENGILDAFNVTRAGGDAALFDRIFMGLTVPGAGTVNGTSLTGSRALRLYTQTNTFLANGDVGGFANFLNTTAALAGENGGLLRRAGLPENFIVVNPQYGSVTLNGNSGNSSYHSMQAQLTKRYSRNVSGEISYVWSKVLGFDTDRDPRNRQLSKGLLDSYRPHSFKAHGTWALPFGPQQALLNGAPAWLNRVVEGWELSAIFSKESGAPLGFSSNRQTVSSRATNTADLVGALPENTGKVRVRNGFVEYFEDLSVQRAPLPNFGADPTLPGRFTNQVVVDRDGNIVLQNPTPGRTGNTAHNLSILGPSRVGVDLAATKHMRLTETTSFTLRVDAINAFNSPQWGRPNTDLNSDQFGRITSATGSRTITLNARIDF